MSVALDMKAKLGLNVFKPGGQRHVRIKPGAEKSEKLRPALYVCPAGLYSLNKQGEVEVDPDGCLECGACRIACGPEALEWCYPEGGTGVQYRFG